MNLSLQTGPSTVEVGLFFALLWFLPLGAWVLRRRIASSRGAALVIGRAFQVVGGVFALVAVPLTAMVLFFGVVDVIEQAQMLWPIVFGFCVYRAA